MIEIKRKNSKGLSQLIKNFKEVTKTEIAVGFPAGKDYQPYTDEDGNSISLLEVAASNCFGTDKVPQRDFMSYARISIKQQTGKIMEGLARLAATDELNSRRMEGIQMLQEAAGQAGQAAIQQAIIDLRTPPNAPMTIAKKGSSNPLIDTGKMKDSVTYVVREKK